MFEGYSQSSSRANYNPVMVIAGYPLYFIQLCVVVQVVAMFITSFFSSSGWQLLAFSSLGLSQGFVWQLFSYPLFEMPSIWWAITMLIIFFSGPEVEKYIGRKNMVLLYVAMVFCGSLPLLLTTFLLDFPFGFAGSLTVMFGVFVALATLYPNVQFNSFFFTITLKLAAIILFVVNSMMYVAYGQWPGALSLFATSACAFMYLKFIGVRGGFTWWEDWIENRRLRREARKRNIRVMRERRATQSMDQILDKISRDGISSLSPEERDVLEKARTNLIKRDQDSKS